MSWLYLIIAGLFEVGFAISMSFIARSKSVVSIGAFLICLSLSFYFLQLAVRTIPVGTAYPVWTGIGTLGTVVLGILIWKEPVTLARMVWLTLLVTSIVGLKLQSSH